MSHPISEHGSEKKHGFSVVHYLEGGDGVAHVIVALFLLLLALCILAYGTYSFVSDLSLGLLPFKTPDGVEIPLAERFGATALVFLSDLLFAVVVLELLSTILTYIQARNLEATIKDFLVVALISSIRKILLVGAQSSIHQEGGPAGFVQEAWGTVISILGILLLIGGLLLLDRRAKAKALEATEAAAAMAVAENLDEQPI